MVAVAFMLFSSVLISYYILEINTLDTVDAASLSSETVTTTVTTVIKKTSVTTRQIVYPIDINRATKDELMSVNGVGEKTAEAICELKKKNGKISDMKMLLEIDGIGEKRYNEMCKCFYVSDSDKQEMIAVTEPPVQTSIPTTSEPSISVRKTVNINTASVDEIEKALLIKKETATAIVDFRNKIGKYTNVLEILYVDGVSDELYISIQDYLTC